MTMRLVHCAGFVVLVAAAASWYVVQFPYLWDVEQCDRVCNLRFRDGRMFPGDFGLVPLVGEKINPTTCQCAEMGTGKPVGEPIPRLYDEVDAGYPYIWKDPRVCGNDGKVYSSKAHAHNAGAKVINCGPCGRCSNEMDVKQMRKLGSTLVKKVSPCIIAYLIFPFTKVLDQWCMENIVGFSPACSECWVQDHGCLFANCFGECILKKDAWTKLSSGSKNMFQGRNTDVSKTSDVCIACMEVRCSKPYIDSCGANRRTGGVRSEIERDTRELCTDVDL